MKNRSPVVGSPSHGGGDVLGLAGDSLLDPPVEVPEPACLEPELDPPLPLERGGDADTVIDAKGSTVIPGLIDSHAHPTLGDFTPRQRTIDFIESTLHGGVTTMISAGEPHVPGRPKEVVGFMALAIAVARAYATFRPGGVKVRAADMLGMSFRSLRYYIKKYNLD